MQTTQDATAKRAVTTDDLIEKYGYKTMLLEKGLITTGSCVRRNHSEAIANRIVERLREIAKEAKTGNEATTAEAKPGKRVKAAKTVQPPQEPVPAAITKANIEGHFVAFTVKGKQMRGIVLCEEGSAPGRSFDVLCADHDVLTVKESNIARVGQHFSALAEAALS